MKLKRTKVRWNEMERGKRDAMNEKASAGTPSRIQVLGKRGRAVGRMARWAYYWREGLVLTFKGMRR